MLKPFVFRALSPHHATAMDLDYLLRVVEAARKYGFNALQICGATHGDVGNLDGVTEFVRFPRANEVRDMGVVRAQRDILRGVCRAAREHGMEVYYWHHELWYPQRLSEVYPDWFVPAPDNRFRRDLYIPDGLVPRTDPDSPFWQFLEAKFDEAFDQCPELDGTVMTIQESRVPVYCLYDDFDPQVDSLVDLYRRLEALHRRVGKKWMLRTFAWREHEYRVVTEAVRRYRSPAPVESKGVPMDWSFYYTFDPLLAQFEGMTRHVELAPSCEFHGVTLHPVGHPLFYVHNLQFAGERGHTGAVLRIDRAGNSMLGGPDEGVLACVGRWLNDPAGTDVDRAYSEWLMHRYGIDRPAADRLRADVMENCWNATLRCYHEGKIYIGDSFWLGYDRLFFTAERHFCVEYDQPEPLAEKDLACGFADRAAAAVDDLKPLLKGDDHLDLWRRVLRLQLNCRVYRALVAALAARQRQLYGPSERNLSALRGAIDDLESAGAEVSREFPEPDSPDRPVNGQRQPGVLVERFARAFRTDLPNLKSRRIVSRTAPARLGGRAAFRGQRAFQPSARGRRVVLRCRAGRDGVLVVFAGTEMCVCRPLLVRCGDWEHRFDVGQFAWFLAHDRIRRYEAVVPARCFDGDGRCTLVFSAPEPDRSPYITGIRMETED